MAKIFVLKKSIRGIATCDKCGKQIHSKEEYFKAIPYKRNPIIRCFNCGIMPYETSGSRYIKAVGDLKYRWQEKYPTHSIDNIISDIEIIRSNLEDSLYNLPEQFQDNSILQDRLDAIDDCINELENIDVDSFDDIELKIEIKNALSNLLLK